MGGRGVAGQSSRARGPFISLRRWVTCFCWTVVLCPTQQCWAEGEGRGEGCDLARSFCSSQVRPHSLLHKHSGREKGKPLKIYISLAKVCCGMQYWGRDRSVNASRFFCCSVFTWGSRAREREESWRAGSVMSLHDISMWHHYRTSLHLLKAPFSPNSYIWPCSQSQDYFVLV